MVICVKTVDGRWTGVVLGMFQAMTRFAFKFAFRDVHDAEVAALFDKFCAVNGVIAVSRITVRSGHIEKQRWI
jgi:hypothetical protein